jgi:hypothetical protein
VENVTSPWIRLATLKKPWDLEMGMSKDRWAKKKALIN